MIDEFSVLGVDIGNSGLKLGTEFGPIYEPALVAPAGATRLRAMAGVKTFKPPLRVETQDGAFYIGPHAYHFGNLIQNLAYDRVGGTPEVRALLYAGLTRYLDRAGEAAGKPLHVVAGLPLEVVRGKAGAVTPPAVRRWLECEHAWCIDGREYGVKIADVRTTGQAVGAMYDYLLLPTGEYDPDRKKAVNGLIGVISLGFGTIEAMAIDTGRAIEDKTDGAAHGVRRLLEEACPESIATLGELDEALRDDRLDVGRSLDAYTSRVIGQIEKVWGSQWKKFPLVILAGGGVRLIGDRLEAQFHGQVHKPSDPVQSIAQGLYKLGLNLRLRGR